MEVSFGCSTLSEICHCYPILAIDPVVVASSRGVWDLGAERRRDRGDVEVPGAVVNWHLSALAEVGAISHHLVGHLLQRKPSPKERCVFSVLREDEVLRLEVRRRANH